MERGYPKNWRSISFRIRFDEAKGICQECGARHGETSGGRRVVIDCSHDNHFEPDCRPENLTARCKSCHLRHDAFDNARRRKYGRRYNWPHQLRLEF